MELLAEEWSMKGVVSRAWVNSAVDHQLFKFSSKFIFCSPARVECGQTSLVARYTPNQNVLMINDLIFNLICILFF